MKRGGVILCGGKSTRMGRDKATLPFGPELMLQRVVRLLGEAVSGIVVVAAPGQELPPLPDGVRVARDEREGRGPLEGLYAGFSAIRGHADAVFATSCDVPLLMPAFVERMFELLSEYDIAVPKDEKFHHPLGAVYRVDSVTPHIKSLLAADRMRPFFLFERCETLEVPVADLRAVDQELASLRNLNHWSNYEAALASAGFTDDDSPKT
ncbi:MAG: molybdenum cofactor guanylyltransferase [Pirellulales bacterium]|nr:molybdenum cofactor guanylyltransferase [Pirellulales bacterium]